jgi:hypothetical protein
MGAPAMSLARLLVVVCAVASVSFAAEPEWMAGAAQVDITPDYPVRLSGYGNRRAEHEGVEQRIFAKALALGDDEGGPALLLTVDNCAVPATVRDAVLARLAGKSKVSNPRLAICSSHTHCAPMLAGSIPNIFSSDIPPEHWQRIERYTAEVTAKLEQVALAALAARRPARLAWGVGHAGFAHNRRVAYAFRPEDHSLPVLRVSGADGKPLAIVTSYACHCTTIAFNRIHGDWAGCAQEALEKAFPGAVALVAIGCGADQNPNPRGVYVMAREYGESVATEAARLVRGTLKPLTGKLACRLQQIDLAFETPATREVWEARAKEKAPNVSYHARRQLARLDRGETLQATLSYPVQAWTFGRDLAVVFLAGEVVVDYSLRLKRECDSERMWVNGYSNDVPCYIPSRRVLREGGYEGATAMYYYDRPGKFAPDVEERIVRAVHALLGPEFLSR